MIVNAQFSIVILVHWKPWAKTDMKKIETVDCII